MVKAWSVRLRIGLFVSIEPRVFQVSFGANPERNVTTSLIQGLGH